MNIGLACNRKDFGFPAAGVVHAKMAEIRFVGVESRKYPAIAGTRGHSCAAKRHQGYKT